ncbi:MAG: NYN domain-containing protein [Patescibacteria group bacterium]
MGRYAFIDVQNTESTTNQLLGFEIDWHKLYAHLKERWECEKIFFYSGIQNGDNKKIIEHQKLSELGYIVRTKLYFIYKNPDQIIKTSCPKCKTEITHKINKGTKWKSNCDVEFSVDAVNHMVEDAEYLFFTGDGDFEYLIRDAVENKIKVYIVSSAKKIKTGPRYFISRLSSKLRNLVAEKRKSIFFIEINDWKMRIKKDNQTKENAVQAGVF